MTFTEKAQHLLIPIQLVVCIYDEKPQSANKQTRHWQHTKLHQGRFMQWRLRIIVSMDTKRLTLADTVESN